MRIILRTMDLPGKSAALYRPRKSPIDVSFLQMKPQGRAQASHWTEQFQHWASISSQPKSDVTFFLF